jgi:hypothetical protein
MRRVLRDYHVGAVMIGLLLYNAVGDLIKALDNPVLMWVQRSVQHNALSPGAPWFNKAGILVAIADSAFYFVISALLAWWIYREPTAATVKLAKS